MRRLFFNSGELRPGWRLLVFAMIIFALVYGESWLSRRFQVTERTSFDAISTLTEEIFLGIPVLAATLIMARLERRRLADYGIPATNLLGRDFLTGSLSGLAGVSLLVGAIALGGGYSVVGLITHGRELWYHLALWIAASALIGLREEITFHGYLLFNLASGIGFWPASFLISVAFGALHYFSKPHERWEDFASTGLFSLFACLALRRTGSLAWPIGFHAAFDFAAIFIYSGQNGGLFAVDRLFETHWSGPQWLSGGLLGPEASLLVFFVFGLLFVAFSLTYRKARFPIHPNPPREN